MFERKQEVNLEALELETEVLLYSVGIWLLLLVLAIETRELGKHSTNQSSVMIPATPSSPYHNLQPPPNSLFSVFNPYNLEDQNKPKI